MDKKYQSKIEYSKKYNSLLSTIQISKDTHKKLKEYCIDKKVNVKDFIEEIILKNI